MTYALDTNILSYMLKSNPTVVKKFLEVSNNGHNCVIPPVAYYEIKRGLIAVNATAKEKAFDKLCNAFGVGQMTLSSWLKAANIYAINRNNGQMIEDVDLFIAAFCLAHGYTLVTANTKHFEIIDGLAVVDWTV